MMEICAKCRKPDLCERRGQCMDAAASEPAPDLNRRLEAFADSLMSRDTSDPLKTKMIEETERRIRQALIHGTSHPEAMKDASEDLYWRLHDLSKRMESNGWIDSHEHPSAYATILDTMKAVREAPSSAVFNNLFEQAKRIAAERDACIAVVEKWRAAYPSEDGTKDALEELRAPATPPEGQVWVREGDGAFVMRPETFVVPAAEREALRLFALAMLEHWPLGEVDGGELQEEAVKHGLLVPETRTAVCSEEGCNCAEYYSAEEWAEGITCYRKAAWLKGMAT